MPATLFLRELRTESPVVRRILGAIQDTRRGPWPHSRRQAAGPASRGWSQARTLGEVQAARAALARAERAAHHARIPALTAEVESASLVLNTPAARLIASGEERLLLLEEVEALLASKALVVDAYRNRV